MKHWARIWNIEQWIRIDVNEITIVIPSATICWRILLEMNEKIQARRELSLKRSILPIFWHPHDNVGAIWNDSPHSSTISPIVKLYPILLINSRITVPDNCPKSADTLCFIPARNSCLNVWWRHYALTLIVLNDLIKVRWWNRQSLQNGYD